MLGSPGRVLFFGTVYFPDYVIGIEHVSYRTLTHAIMRAQATQPNTATQYPQPQGLPTIPGIGEETRACDDRIIKAPKMKRCSEWKVDDGFKIHKHVVSKVW